MKSAHIKILLIFFLLVLPNWSNGQEVLRVGTCADFNLSGEECARAESLSTQIDKLRFELTKLRERKAQGDITPEEFQKQSMVFSAELSRIGAEYQVITKQSGISQDRNDLGKSCVPFSGSFDLSTCFNVLIGFMAFMVQSAFAGIVAWIQKYLFTVALDFSIQELGLILNDPVVSSAWETARDLVNILFIFLLLYVAAKTTLSIGSGDTKKLIAKIILVALVINFSWLIPRVVIDISNVLAYQLYRTASPTGSSISHEIISRTGMYDYIFSEPTNPVLAQQAESAGSIQKTAGILISTLGITLMMVMLGFVLVTGAALFIVRSVALIFLVILSPLALGAFVVPGLAGYGKKWWDNLLSYSFFAPAFMFMMLFTVKLASANIEAFATTYKILFFFIVIFAFGYSMLLASKMGVAGAKFSESMLGRARGIIEGGFRSRGAAIASNLTSLPASKLADSNTVKRWATSGQGTLRRAVADTLKDVSNAKFFKQPGRTDWLEDKRGKQAEYLKKSKPEVGLDYLTSLTNAEDRKKAYEAMSSTKKLELEKAAEESGKTIIKELRSGLKTEDREKLDEDEIKREKNLKDAQKKRESDQAVKDLKAMQEKGKAPVRDKDGKETGKEEELSPEDIERRVQSISAERVKDIVDIMKFVSDNEGPRKQLSDRILKNLSPKQLKSLMESGDIDIATKSSIREVLKTWSNNPTEREKNKDLYEYTKTEDYEKVTGSTADAKVKTTQKAEEIQRIIKSELDKKEGYDEEKVKSQIGRLDDDTLKKIDLSIFQDTRTLEHLRPRDLQAALKDRKGVDISTRNDIRLKIQGDPKKNIPGLPKDHPLRQVLDARGPLSGLI